MITLPCHEEYSIEEQGKTESSLEGSFSVPDAGSLDMVSGCRDRKRKAYLYIF